MQKRRSRLRKKNGEITNQETKPQSSGNNRVKLTGTLVAAPTLQRSALPNAASVALYSIAVPTGKRIDVFNISSTGKQAELDVRYLKRGNTVVVEGDLQTSMQNRGGQQIPAFNVNAQRVTYLAPAATSSKKTTPEPNSQRTSDDEQQF